MNEKKKEWKTYGHYDVAVIGAGPSGIGAALAAARKGLRTIIIETYGYAGGVGTQSCCPIYFGFGVDGKQITSGISEEFIHRMDQMGAASFLIDDGTDVADYRPIGNRTLNAKIALDCETMKLIFNRMLTESGVDCLYYTTVAEAFTENGKIKSVLIACLDGTYLLEADSFIDATGNAQLCFLANPSSVIHCTKEDGMHNSMFFEVGGVTPFDPVYNRKVYELDRKAGKMPEMVWPHFGYSVELNPGVVQISVCFDMGDGANSAEMTQMSMRLRENVFKMVKYLKENMPGFRNCYLLNTASKVGVRSSRNIIGDLCFTEEMLFSDVMTEPITLCRRRYGMHSNQVMNFCSDWTRLEKGTSGVPMKCLIPKAFDNVLVAGRCISSVPQLIGTYRMMNMCMSMGEAAGLMSYLSTTEGCDTHHLQYSSLKPILLENGIILE